MDRPTASAWRLQGNRRLHRPTGGTEKSDTDRYLDIGCSEYGVYGLWLIFRRLPKTATLEVAFVSQMAASRIRQPAEIQYRGMSWPPSARGILHI
jgi:hypothetical protein